MSPTELVPAAAGLTLALLGPPLVAAIGERSGCAVVALRPLLVGQSLLVSLLLGILAIVRVWEGRAFDSIGLGRLSAASLVWGLGFAAFFIFLLGPLLLRLPAWLRLGGFEATLSGLARLPVWYLVLAVAVGGTVEEVLYRGYAVDRLAALTGSYWAAGTIAVLAFALAHVPTWGWGPALTTAISGAAFTAFYVWRHDLWSNIIAHGLTDFVGIALAPLLACFSFRNSEG